ncbi:MAG TPA: acetate uptake transporter [Terracidiphilus sp.]|nr:acetate uptake transporter [Terracidiphilus sp.]
MPDTTVADRTGNPAPLGLMGFGMTTVLLNLHNAGFIGLDTMILSMGIFYGGMAQVIAGIMEWKKGNTFACTAFTSYGMFWLTLVALIALPHAGLGLTAPSGDSIPFYLAAWGVFTLVLFLGTLRLNRALQVVFATLTILFFMLAAGEVAGSAAITKAAGWVGLFCGASAIYTGLAQVLNEVNGKTVWPLGVVARS